MSNGQTRATVFIGGNDRQLDGTLASSRKKVRSWAKGVKADLQRGLKGAFSTLENLAGFGGVATLALATRQVSDFEKRLLRLRIASRSSAADMAALKKQIFEIGERTGADPDVTLAGVEKFVQLTGDMATARASMETFARVAQASGSEMEDIATTAASMSQQMGLTADQMEHAFSILIAQGKSGAVELKGMAQIAEGLLPTFRLFGNTGTKGLAEMGALLQTMKQGFGGEASETATGLTSLMGVILKQQKRLKKAGAKLEIIDPKTKKRSMKSITDIIFEIDRVAEKMAKKKGMSKEAALATLIGDKEAIKAILPVLSEGRKKLEDLTAEGLRANDVNEDFAIYSDSAAASMERTQASIKKTFNGLLAKHLGTIARAFEAIAAAIKFIADNPVTTMAAFSLLKGGGMFARAGAGLSEALASSGGGGGGGGAGSIGAPMYGPITREQWASSQWSRVRYGGKGSVAGLGLNASTPGNMMMGAGVGLAMARTVGRDLPAFAQAAMVTSNALAGLPGPIGAVAKGAALAGDVLVAYFASLDEEIDQKNKQRAKATFGEYGSDRAGDLANARAQLAYLNGKSRRGEQLTPEEQARKQQLEQQRNSASEYFIRRFGEMGALKKGADGKFAIDQSVLANQLASDPDIADKEGFAAVAEAALKATEENKDLANIAQGLLDIRQGKNVEADIRAKLAAQAKEEETKALAANAEKMGLNVTVKTVEGISVLVENDKSARRKGGK